MNWKQVYLTWTILVLLSHLAAAQEFVGINCGSEIPFVNQAGEQFLADTPYSADIGYGYVGGIDREANQNEIFGGIEDCRQLYAHARRDDFSYQFDLSAGQYAIELMLADFFSHGPGFNSMSIVVAGDTLVEGLDLCKEVGRSFALPVRFLTNASDGQIVVEFLNKIGYASCSAIAIHEVTSDNSPPDVLSGFGAIGGYGQNILYWDYCTESDLAGYRVYRESPGSQWEQITDDPYPYYRFLDNDVESDTEYRYYVTAIDHWGNESDPTEQQSATAVANASTDLLRIQITADESELYDLNTEWWGDTYVNAALMIEESSYPDGKIRYRGNYTRNLSKKNYKLKLPAGESFFGRDRINLNSEMVDYSMMKARISYRTYDLLDIPNPDTKDVHLEVNGEYRGVYLEIENVDNHFLERRGLSPAGNLYKAVSNLRPLSSCAEYRERYPRQNNPNSECTDIVGFINWLNNVPEDRFREEVLHRVAMDEFLNMYTCVIATAEQDFAGHNYYMYSNPTDGKWYFIPWDHNTSLTEVTSPLDLFSLASPSPVGQQSNILIDYVLNDPLFRYAYCKKLERFIEREFSFVNVSDRILQRYDDIMFDAVRDVYKRGFERSDNIFQGIVALPNFVQERLQFLQSEIPGFISDPDRGPEFRLNEIMTANESTIADENGDFDPWIEIINCSGIELDLSGFTLHSEGNSWELSDDIVLEADGYKLLWLDGEPEEGANHASFYATGESGELRLIGNYGTLSDSVFVPELDADQAWSRVRDATGGWSDLSVPTPGTTNTPMASPAKLVINELQALNSYTVADNHGDFDDWIEIYNPTDRVIELTGLYLSDDFERPLKWAFPDTSLGAQSFLVVWCDEEPEEGLTHSTFKLSGDGEEIVLTDRDATTTIDQVIFGEQMGDHSYGRIPDGGRDWFVITEPSPGETNLPNRLLDETPPTLPKQFRLHQNYPNPYNSETTFRLDLPEQAFVSLTIYDITGRLVNRVVDRELRAGEHRFAFESSLLASGVYFYKVNAGSFADAKKMVVLK